MAIIGNTGKSNPLNNGRNRAYLKECRIKTGTMMAAR
jgi:hypothetical protein